ncbi:MAG: right-handed parallel beta-helix repeat-containing protein, partial [Elusimicrobiota bacterium]
MSAFLAWPATGGMKPLPLIEIPSAGVKNGIIYSDETWEGKITVKNYLQVARGAAVTVLPGAEIIFERGEDWPLPLVRGGTSGVMNEMDSPHARIWVYGRFLAKGETGNPVVFSGPSLGGIYALGKGELVLEHFRVNAAAACAVGAADQARLECRNGVFSACERGALTSGNASGIIAGCFFNDGKGPALRVLDNSSLIISASQFLGNSCGIQVSDRGSVRSTSCSFNGHPWRPPKKNGSPARSGYRLLFRFAAATCALPVFSQLYRRIYLVGPLVARFLLYMDGVKSLYLYRGMTKNGWIPASSDMALACLIRRLPAEEDWRLYSTLRRRQRLLKALLPYTGEIMTAQTGEFMEFMSVWGIKGREFYSSSKLLCGNEPERVPSVGDGLAADLTEAFYAYTILSGHFFSDSRSVPFIRRNCLKNCIDVMRYLDSDSLSRDSRGGYALAAGIRLN